MEIIAWLMPFIKIVAIIICVLLAILVLIGIVEGVLATILLIKTGININKHFKKMMEDEE